MPRRPVGVGAIKKDKAAAERFKAKTAQLQESSFQAMTNQMETFREKLEEFARSHKQEIKKDPEFRRHFQEMCSSIGVDPLASSKGFWSEMLGFGDFYYELGVQIIEVCMATSHKTGGLMELGELKDRLIRSRGGSKSLNKQEISEDDVLRAIKKLKVLGNGFTVIPLGSGRFLVQSIPGELSMDQTAILQLAESNGGQVNVTSLRDELGWELERSNRSLDKLLSDGLAWIDNQSGEEYPIYWIPSIFTSLL